MYRCESWTIRKAECRRVDVFEMWCWKKLLRVPWIAGRSNQSTVKEINPGRVFIGRSVSKAEAPILWPPDVEKILILERLMEEGGEIVGWHPDSMDMNLSKFQEIVEDRGAQHAAVQEVTKTLTWLEVK